MTYNVFGGTLDLALSIFKEQSCNFMLVCVTYNVVLSVIDT